VRLITKIQTNFCCPEHFFKRVFVSLLSLMSDNRREEWLVNIPLYALSETGAILDRYVSGEL